MQVTRSKLMPLKYWLTCVEYDNGLAKLQTFCLVPVWLNPLDSTFKDIILLKKTIITEHILGQPFEYKQLSNTK